MVPGSEVEVDAPPVRFGRYIDELHEFFEGRGQPFGSPPDLSRLAERLSTPSFFQDEMASMVRAVIYRESEGVGREQLLELIAVAAGGPLADPTAPELRSAVYQLSTFLSAVLRSLWKNFPGELEDATADSAELERESGVPKPAALPIAALDADRRSEEPAAPPQDSDSAEREPWTSLAMAQVAARARMALHRADNEQRTPETRQPPTPSAASPTPMGPAASWGRPASIILTAIGGIALGLASASLLRYQGALQLPDLRPAPRHGSSSATGRPSPDLPLRDTRFRHLAGRHHGSAQYAEVHPAPDMRATTTLLARKRASPFSQPRALHPEPRAGTRPLRFPARVPGLGSPADSVVQETQTAQESYPAPDPKPLRARLSAEPLVRIAPAFSRTRPGVFLASSGAMTSNLLYAPAPLYPAEAIATGTQGRVVLQALVWRDGSVAATHVLQGERTLGAAAQKAIRLWRYRPYLVNGHATDVATVITVDFRIPG